MGFLAPITNNHTRAIDDFSGISLSVEGACWFISKDVSVCSQSRVEKEDWPPQKKAKDRKWWGKPTQAGPLAQQLPILHLDQRNAVFRTQRNYKFLVGFLLAALVEDAHVRLAAIQRFTRFPQPASEAVMDQGQLEHTFQGIVDRHLGGAACGGGAACFDFFAIGDFGGGGGGLFSVRL